MNGKSSTCKGTSGQDSDNMSTKDGRFGSCPWKRYRRRSQRNGHNERIKNWTPLRWPVNMNFEETNWCHQAKCFLTNPDEETNQICI